MQIDTQCMFCVCFTILNFIKQNQAETEKKEAMVEKQVPNDIDDGGGINFKYSSDF